MRYLRERITVQACTSIIAMAILISLPPAVAAVESDILLLRSGDQIEGQFIRQHQGFIQFRDKQGVAKRLPLRDIKLLRFGDADRASTWNNTESLRRRLRLKEQNSVRILPTETLAPDVIHGIRNAKESIQILSYNMRGSSQPPVGEFYKLLCEKATAGLDVTIVLEFGSGTSKRIRDRVMQFGEYLRTSGVKVLYLQEYKIMHKKVIIVDDKTVWLGSANLTSAAMTSNEEMNIRTSAPKVVAQAIEDFAAMCEKALPAEKLKY